MFLPGTTPGTTLAAFQSIVSGAAAESGLSIQRMQPLPTDEVQGLAPYLLAVDAAGSLQQVQAFLVEVEAVLPIVIVTGFDIQPRSAEASSDQFYPSEDLALSLRLEAYAWRASP
jgi:Tfp pilus assembly protein PilO